jgi:hypothetical protein
MYRLFRGAVLGLEVQCLMVLGLRLEPRGGHARCGLGRDQYDFGPRGSGFQSYSSSRPCFPLRGARFPQMGHDMFGVFSNIFLGQMSQHLYPSQFTNPSVVPFTHPMSFY